MAVSALVNPSEIARRKAALQASSTLDTDFAGMAHPSSREHRTALLQLHVAVLLAGGPGLFGKFLSVGPEVITFGRTTVASVALLAIAWLLKVQLSLRDGRSCGILAASGVMMAAHWLSFFQSIQVSTVAVGLLTVSTFPLLVTFLEPIFFREKLQQRDVYTAVVVTVGLVVVVPSFELSNRVTQGVLWGLVAAFAGAVATLLSRSSARVYPALSVAFYQQLVAAFCTAPLVWQSARTITSAEAWLLLLLGTVFTALLQWLFLASLQHVRAQTASVLFGLEPFYGILLAATFLGERPSIRTVIGGVIICSAVAFASLAPGRNGDPKPFDEPDRRT